jgi:hypothetical protein
LYFQKGDAGKAEALLVLRTYWLQHKTDEDALRPLMELLGEQERYQEAEQYYQQFLLELADLGPGKDGQPLAPDAQTLDVREYLRTKSIRRSQSQPFGGRAQDKDLLRRQFLQESLRTASDSFVNPNLLLRLQHAFGQPLPIDETFLQVLEARTEQFWHNRHTATFTVGDLWRYIADHLHKTLTFLDTSLLPLQRSRLCALLCKTAQLAGVLAYDAGQSEHARTWYHFAILASHEGHDPALEAIVLGWMAFTWLSDGSYNQALQCIQQAQEIARRPSDCLLIAWLQATEAEILGHLHQPAGCLTALYQAEMRLEAAPLPEHLPLFNLDRKQFWGYQGACLQQLYRKESPATSGYLREAQAALERAISGPTLIRRRITYLHDLAGVYARQAEREAACELIAQSLPLLGELGERTAKKRLTRIRAFLGPAEQNASVRALDEQIEALERVRAL